MGTHENFLLSYQLGEVMGSRGLVVGCEKDVSLFLDKTGEPATQQRHSSRLKNKDTSFSQPTTHPINL